MVEFGPGFGVESIGLRSGVWGLGLRVEGSETYRYPRHDHAGKNPTPQNSQARPTQSGIDRGSARLGLTDCFRFES